MTELKYFEPQKYDKLLPLDETNKRGHDTSLLYEQKITYGKSFIVQDRNDDLTNKKKKRIFYMHFRSVKDYHLYYKNARNLLTHEVILSDQPQKPKFDIDEGTEKDHEAIIEAIEAAFYEEYTDQIDPPNIVVINSVNTKPGETKLSKHIIITNYAFLNTAEARRFTEECVRPHLTETESKYLDDTNKLTQHFRLPGTINDKGRRLVIKDGVTFDDLVVTNTHNVTILPEKVNYNEQKVNRYSNVDLSKLPFEVQSYMEAVDSSIFTFNKQVGNILIYDRLKPSYCDLCDRVHDSVGIYICVYPDDKAIRGCYRAKDENSKSKYHVIEKKKSPAESNEEIYWLDVVKKYHSRKLDKFQLDQLVEDLKKVIVVKDAGGSSLILLKTGPKTYDMQKMSTFSPAASRKYVTYEGKPLSFDSIINTQLTQYAYRDVQFAPDGVVPYGVFNLFMGLKAISKQNDILIQPILNHIREVWASSDDTIYNYLLDWLSAVVKGVKTGTVIVLYSGKHGAGKNIISDFLKNKVIGLDYATDINDIERLTGKFNAKFVNKIFTVINEANNIEGSYHKTFDILKDLITSPTVTIEKKGIDSFDVADFNNYLITTNNDRPIKIEEHDRRYTPIKINESKANDKAYFDNLIEYTNGKFATDAANAFLYFLTNRVITNNVHRALTTEWKKQLIRLYCLNDPVTMFTQYIKYEKTENNEIKTDDIYRDYEEFCSREQFKPNNKRIVIEQLIAIRFILENKRVNRRINGKQCNYNVSVINSEYTYEEHGDQDKLLI